MLFTIGIDFSPNFQTNGFETGFPFCLVNSVSTTTLSVAEVYSDANPL